MGKKVRDMFTQESIQEVYLKTEINKCGSVVLFKFSST